MILTQMARSRTHSLELYVYWKGPVEINTKAAMRRPKTARERDELMISKIQRGVLK